ncbi:MAG TPA: 50S ribosomal protein L31 [Patescibacteria group bacterium]|nr:50S ribosomal protein L31 [Patescibacteria group bacterium]
MKSNHPKWYPEAKVTCTCGHTFTTGSTKPEIRVEICSACHPFFTGEMRYIDTQGRVEKFQAKQKAAQTQDWKKKKKTQEEKEERPKTLKEMLQKKG